MKMFEDLNSFEAVKMDDKVCVQLPKGLYRVNEQDLLVTAYNGEQHVLMCDVTIHKQSIIPSKLDYYRHKETDARLSVDEYNTILVNIHEKFSEYYDAEQEEYIYPNIDVEYDHRKQLEYFKVFYTPVMTDKKEEWETVDVRIKGDWIDTGSDFIETPYQQGQVSFGGSLFRVHTGQIAWDEFNKQCSLYNKQYVGDTIRFVTVDGNYVFASSFDHLRYIKDGVKVTELYKTLIEAKDRENEVRSMISKRMFVLFGDQDVDKLLRKQLHSDLYNLKDRLQKLDVKVKSQSDKRSMINKLSELLAKLEK